MGTESNKKRVGIWIRVSTEDQAQGESPRHHEERARAYAIVKDWSVVELYNLSGVSGKTVKDHPEAQRMLHDIARGHISGLIFSKLARLARNTRELLDFSDHFRAHDAALISLQEAIDTSSPAGRLFYTMIAAMAQWEREEISSRVAASVPIRAKLGKNTGGQAPFGYMWVENQLVLDEDEAPIRKHMYELYLTHKRKKTTARVMNEMGYRTRGGSLFRDGTMERLLRDPIAFGKRRANYTKSRGDGQQWDEKPEEEWVWVSCPAMISEEMYNHVQETLNASANGKRVARKPAKHIFTGVVFCTCGGRMRVPSNSPKYICKKCKRKIHTEDLTAIYTEQLKQFLISQEMIARYIANADEEIQDQSKQLAILEKEEATLRSKIDKTYQLYLNDEMTTDGYGERCRPLEERLAQITRDLPERRATLDLARVNILSSSAVLDQTTDLASRWDSMNTDEKYMIVESITQSIIIGNQEVTINFHYLPFLFQDSDNLAPHGQGLQAATNKKLAG